MHKLFGLFNRTKAETSERSRGPPEASLSADERRRVLTSVLPCWDPVLVRSEFAALFRLLSSFTQQKRGRAAGGVILIHPRRPYRGNAACDSADFTIKT